MFDRVYRSVRDAFAGAALLVGLAVAPCVAAGIAEPLRLRALLFPPAAAAHAPVERRNAQGEARLTVRPDGDARLDLVSWDLPDDTVQVVLRLEAAGGSTLPVVALPLQRDLDEGRVIGARFTVDADMRARLERGEGRLLLLPHQAVDAAIGGALHRHGARPPAPLPIEPPSPSLPPLSLPPEG